MINIDNRKKLWLALAIIYFIIRFIFTEWLDSLMPYCSYIFEVLVVLAVIPIGGGGITAFPSLKPNYRLLNQYLLALPLGFFVYKLAYIFQVTIPFDLRNFEAIFLLLCVGPILEEAIFRFFLWKPFELIHPTTALVVTSILFSYSHFHSYWFVVPEIFNFIYYQTAYTLILGWFCGLAIKKYNSLGSAILIHFCFNFGFLVASFI